MTRSPLHRACMALRLPRGLYCHNARADVPLSDAEIRHALRQQHVAAERLTLALADMIAEMARGAARDYGDEWRIAAAVVKERDLPASMVGFLVALAVLPEEGDTDPDEIALVVEAAP